MNADKIEISAGTMEMLERVSTASISLQLLKRGIRSAFMSGIRPLNPAVCRFVAEAYTLRFVPMREDLSKPEILADPTYSPRLVIEEVPAGAALVIDARGVTDVGVVGGIFGIRLKDRGCAAIVTDGSVRDSVEMANCGFPVFCGGVASPASLGRHFGADHQRIIGCAGVAVVPGDILVGDEDGVMLVPRAMAEEVARDGVEQERLETFLSSLVARGRPVVGTYPPNAETRREYDEWVKSQA